MALEVPRFDKVSNYHSSNNESDPIVGDLDLTINGLGSSPKDKDTSPQWVWFQQLLYLPICSSQLAYLLVFISFYLRYCAMLRLVIFYAFCDDFYRLRGFSLHP